MITLADYFAGYPGHAGITTEHRANAEQLLVKVNAVLTEIVAIGAAKLDINPKTGSLISGSRNGGWRPRECQEGAEKSSHKEGRGVDVFDPDGDIDMALTDARLAKHGLYREHPSQTRFWCHLTDRAPRSGKRTFYA